MNPNSRHLPTSGPAVLAFTRWRESLANALRFPRPTNLAGAMRAAYRLAAAIRREGTKDLA